MKYRVEFSSIDIVNATYTAISTRIQEKRELYEKCRNSTPFYPDDCYRIEKEIGDLKQALISIDNYKLIEKEL